MQFSKKTSMNLSENAIEHFAKKNNIVFVSTQDVALLTSGHHRDISITQALEAAENVGIKLETNVELKVLRKP